MVVGVKTDQPTISSIVLAARRGDRRCATRWPLIGRRGPNSRDHGEGVLISSGRNRFGSIRFGSGLVKYSSVRFDNMMSNLTRVWQDEGTGHDGDHIF